MAVSIVVYAISFLLIRLLSRYRELAADRSGALLTGQPSALASALQKVSGTIARIPTKDLREAQPLNAFFFVPALSGREAETKIAELFSTHPPLEKRLAQLAKISAAAVEAAVTVGFLDTLLGRTKPVQPNLDVLFQLPSAAVTLEAATGFTPTGTGSVCFRPVEGRAFADVEKDVRELLDLSGAKSGSLPVEVTRDSYGFTWLVSSHLSTELEDLVTDLHAVNSALVDNGFGPQLLCTLVAFRDDAQRRLALVYLFKRGTFYPFAPLPAGTARQRAGAAGQGASWRAT